MKKTWDKPIPQSAAKAFRADVELSYSGFFVGGLMPKHHVVFKQYFIVKETPKGYWVVDYPFGEMHFCLSAAAKKFAHHDKEQALKSLLRRKELEIEHLRRRLREAKMKRDVAKTALERWHDSESGSVECRTY